MRIKDGSVGHMEHRQEWRTTKANWWQTKADSQLLVVMTAPLL